jgi:four helix bundle protein
MAMEKGDLEGRTKQFALRVINFVGNLPKKKATDVIGYQLLKSGTSIGANYRKANRAESHDDFIHKIGIVEKEASETQYWLELLQETQLGNAEENSKLLRECRELTAIFTAIGKTAKARRVAKHRTESVQNSPPAITNSKSTIRDSQ